MAGRRKEKRDLTPAERRFRDEMSKTLAAAVKLDQIEAGAGDRLRAAAATALATARSESIGVGGSGSRTPAAY